MLHDHAVAFYDDDREVVDTVARFVADGIRQGTRAVVVATPEHRSALQEALLAMGLDPDEPPVAGNLVMLDARRTLASLMTEDGPDPDRFTDTVAQILRDASTDGAQVRVFGEMVELLWADGDVAGAIALEELWNGMLRRVDFVLLCAYSTAMVDAGVLADVHVVCGQHSAVQAPARYFARDGEQVTSPRVFLPVPEAVASSRRFVDTCLRRKGVADHLIHDASVIASELATNAVLHARAPFRISVDESVGVVCISVQDLGDGEPAPRVAAAGDPALDGRGIEIVDALAQRWGCDVLRQGKVVWAELA